MAAAKRKAEKKRKAERKKRLEELGEGVEEEEEEVDQEVPCDEWPEEEDEAPQAVSEPPAKRQR